MSFKVLRDGEIKAEVDTMEKAFARILNLQGQSFDWAIKHEGWNVQQDASNGRYFSLVRPLSTKQKHLVDRARDPKVTLEVLDRNIQMFQLELDDYNDPKNVPNCDRMRTISQNLEVLRLVRWERKV